MPFLITLCFIVICSIVFVVVKGNLDKSEIAKNEKNIRDKIIQQNLSDTHIIFSPHNNSKNSLSVDEKKEIVSFCKIENETISIDNFRFDQIIGFDVDIDGQSARKISIGGTIAGAALGGGIGALIGSQFGGKKDKVSLMHLVINVNDMSNPIIKLSILKPSFDGKPYSSDNYMVVEASEKAEKWSGIFKIILNKNNGA